jgi:8-oxo-dGTP pyrophosphatase MutT (NUDIX family)
MRKIESAGGVIINEFNEVVIVFTDTHSWQFPKGTVENNEKYLDTALREIEEETGLKNLEYVKPLPIYSRISTHEKDTRREIHYFLFKIQKQDLVPSAEVTQSKWVAIQKVDEELTYPEDKTFIKEALQNGLMTTRNLN